MEYTYFIFPILLMLFMAFMVSIYIWQYMRSREATTYDLTAAQLPPEGPSVYVVPIPERGAEPEHQNTLPPRYSTEVLRSPPPYHLFDPKLRAPWPDTPPPPYEMFSRALSPAP